jgi:LacI family repressor for deo operon, udp, cdd, tsx, nupC, and nupG
MATISDVAKKARVSVGTVSNVLNDRAFVSQKNRRKVKLAIQELRYRPNTIARSLRKNRTYLLAVFIPDVSNPFYSEIVKGVENAARKNGYGALICDIEYEIENEFPLVERLGEKSVDGVLFSAGWNDEEEIIKLSESGIPVVILDRNVENVPISSVEINNQQAVYEAIQYLIDNGHKRIGYISESLKIDTLKKRLEGYKLALNDNDIDYDPEIVFINEKLQAIKVDHGYELMKSVLSSIEEMPTAFFGASDIIAVGAMKAIKEKNLRIPGDISIMGFDDIALSKFTEPPLTTVSQPKLEMGERAVQLLLELIESRFSKPKPSKVILQTTLIVRDSVREF